MIMNNRSLWSRLKMPGVTVSVRPVQEDITMAYKIVTSIDNGFGRQKVVLNSVHDGRSLAHKVRRPYDLKMPGRIGTLDCIYTQCSVPLAGDVYRMIMENHPGARIEMIVPEVAVPGDYLVFRKPSGDAGITVIEALRIVYMDGSRPLRKAEKKAEKKREEHAL